jgi:hypothetical protein
MASMVILTDHVIQPNLMKKLADAAEPLSSISFVKSPQEKATCLLNCSKKIESILHATLGTTQIMYLLVVTIN